MSDARSLNLPHHPKESELHKSVAELLDWVLVTPAMFTTFPAGWGKLSKATAGRLYASGMKAGMPDILVFDRHSHQTTKAIGIELKVGANSQTSKQRATAAALQAVGIRVYVCKSIEDVLAALKDAGITHRRPTLMHPFEVTSHEPRQSI
jgi:hypothetical protein